MVWELLYTGAQSSAPAMRSARWPAVLGPAFQASVVRDLSAWNCGRSAHCSFRSATCTGARKEVSMHLQMSLCQQV